MVYATLRYVSSRSAAGMYGIGVVVNFDPLIASVICSRTQQLILAGSVLCNDGGPLARR